MSHPPGLPRRRSATVQWLPVVVAACCAGCNAASGTGSDATRVVWRVDMAGWGVPAADDAAAYFLTADHQLISVLRTTGEIVDRRPLFTGQANPPGLVAIRAGAVVAAVDNGVLYAVAAVHQPPRDWTFRPPTGGLEDWITGDSTTLYAGSSDAHVYAIDAGTGAPRWSTTIACATSCQTTGPRVRNGVVYVGYHRIVAPSEGGIAALDATTGALRWLRPFVAAAPGRGAGSPGQPVFLDDGTVVAASDDGQIHALDPDTGEPRWTVPSLTGIPATWGGDPALDVRPLTARGSLLVAGSTTGYVVGLDAATGAERWRSRADQGSAIFPLAIDDDLVYATHYGGQLVAFDAHTGAVRWIDGKLRGGGEYVQAPRLLGDALYISGYHGLYALRAGQ